MFSELCGGSCALSCPIVTTYPAPFRAVGGPKNIITKTRILRVLRGAG